MLQIADLIKTNCISFLKTNDIVNFVVDINKDIDRGDLYTNFALVTAKLLGQSPVEIAKNLAEYLNENLDKNIFKKIEAADAYVNFYLVDDFEISDNNIFHKDFTGKKVAYEYTDPNPMKEFHIGHLMSNTIGESLSRIAEVSGAEIKRYSYQGDAGKHLAVTMWGLRFMQNPWPDADDISITDKVRFLGQAYVAGNQELAKAKEKGEDDEEEYKKVLQEIEVMNQKIYDRSDDEVNTLYDQAKEWSLEKFEELYVILGTKFDHYFFESITAPIGLKIVKENLASNNRIFSIGENEAIIFKGEDHGLHTRVFVNAKGIPTYESKEIGLAKMKYELWPFDKSFIITANEQNDAFKVTNKAISLLMPEIGPKMSHIGHGMMRFVGEKMSSRTGKIQAGDELLEDMMNVSYEKMKDRDMEESEKKNIAQDIAVAAIKFSILKQNFKKDIVFDKEKALSLEGDSGPYIQYAVVRINSIIRKTEGLEKTQNNIMSDEAMNLNRTLWRYNHVCFKAIDEFAPQYVAQYLIDLSSKFNNFYNKNKIIENEKVNDELLKLCVKTKEVLSRGLNVLGIRVVERM